MAIEIENLSPSNPNFLEWLDDLLSRKGAELRTRANFLNKKFSKVRQLDKKDTEDFAFYKIEMEVEYLNERFESMYFDNLLFHDGFFNSNKMSNETTSGTEPGCQLMKRLLDHFSDNREKIYEIKYFWFSLKLNEDQLLGLA